MTNLLHLFHIVEMSPWPLLTGLSTLSLTSSLVFWFKFYSHTNFILSFFITLIMAMFWWRDVCRESTFQGFHSWEVQAGLKLGMILFIFSEIMFFFSFFWAFVHASLAPCSDIGLLWPPFFLTPLNPFQVPLLNTVILLSSGVSVTWSHHQLMNNQSASISLLVTILLGAYFTILQGMEYAQSSFSLADSVYGSVFFIATGFHGIHVLVGTSFLLVCLVRLLTNKFSTTHFLGYEFAIWYWHFVDVVWLFLFSLIYWWGF